MPSQPTLRGQVVAVTGGARGIGLATAQALRARGALVAIGDLDPQALDAARIQLGEDVVAAPLDVSDADSFAAFLALAEQRLGPLDVLINNAGIMPIGPFVEETDTQARRAVDVNVIGPLQGTKLALRSMLPRRRGHIVNVASAAGRSPTPGGVTYCATKAATVMLTETARVEHAGSGIQFTCVMPSFTATELIAGTKGTRFVPTVTAQAVAAAIVDALETDRKDVYVPRKVGPMLRTQALLGRRLRDAMNRALGADRTFLEIDQAQRSSYDSRIAGDV
jgi:NAD(P)-dependent dehydrogenase (short-subunit alcohol dehydrogenase family)